MNTDRWSRRASFLAGLFAALIAGTAVGVADVLEALHKQTAPLAFWPVAQAASQVLGVDLLIALPVGLWSGAVLYGLMGATTPRQLLVQLIASLDVRDRQRESQRLAATVATLVTLVVALAGLFGATIPVFARIVRAVNAALVVTVAALASAVLVLLLQPALRVALTHLLNTRARISKRQHGLLSWPVLMLGTVALGGVGMAYAAAVGDRLLYGVDLSPAWWLLGFACCWAAGFLLHALGVVERMVLQLQRPLLFTLAHLLVLAPLSMTAQMVWEQRAMAALVDDTRVASRVVSTLTEFASRSAAEETPIEVKVEKQPEVVVSEHRRPDILVITVDGLRADRLSAYGYGRPTTPNIDTLARLGLTFEHAYSVAPCTSSSLAAVMTVRLPSRIAGAHYEKDQLLVPDDTPTFVEHLRRAGYHTRGYFGVVPTYLPLVEKGFEHFDSLFGTSQKLADKVVDVLTRPRQDDKPLFIWAHFLDVHFPYQAWPGWEQFGDTPSDRYDQEVAYSDSQLARLFAQLNWLGFFERGVVVLAADHGEAFGEHGTELHGDNLFEEQIRIPFIIAAPGLPHGERYAGRVSLLDLGPTLADLAGVERLTFKHDGRSLMGRLRKLEPDRAQVVVEGCKLNTQMALVGEQKLIYRRQAGNFMLFDLRADPSEQTNIFARATDVAAPLVQRLRAEVAKAVNR